MDRMVANRKMLLNQCRDPAPGPNITEKAVGFGALSEQFNQLGELVWAQPGRATRGGLISQGGWAMAGSARQPLADRTLRHAQRGSDSYLGPALLMEFPGALPTTFSPTAGPVGICSAHTARHSTFRPTTIPYLCSYL